MFEKEYREIIELIKRNEDYAVMRTICENIIDVLRENGVKVDGTIIKNVTRTKTLTIVDDFEVKFNGLDFTEHDKKYIDEINDLKKQLAEQTELAEHWYEEADKYEDILYIKAENSGYYDMTLRKFIELEKTAKEQKKQISELESKLAVKDDLLKTVAKRYDNLLLDSCRVTRIDEDINCGEEPLPLSSDEYEECLEEELEDLRDRHQQDCITINQLQTTIDTLIDRYAKLREMRGL